MDLFGHLNKYDYGEVHIKLDKGTGLRAIVAIHDSRLGPALGGCRFIDYDTDEAAVVDALRLAQPCPGDLRHRRTVDVPAGRDITRFG